MPYFHFITIRHNDGTFSAAKKGGKVGKTKKGKGTKIMVITEGEGIPLVAEPESASPAEVTLVESALSKVRIPRAGRGRPKKRLGRLIYDKGCDSDPLRFRLLARGTDLICPHKKNRVKPPTQDGRKLRRYRRRYKIECPHSWLQNYRRLVVRYDNKIRCLTLFYSSPVA